MKGWIRTSLTVTLLGASVGMALADETAEPVYEGRLLRRHEAQSRKAHSEQLRLERAHTRARQRLEQEARYERMGYSPLRPYTNTAYWATGLGTQGVR